MKKILTFVLFFLAVNLSFTAGVFAQTTNREEQLSQQEQPVVIENSQAMTAEFNQETQDPGSKKVKFQMVLTSNINSDRVSISWEVTGSSILVEGYKKTQNITVEQGKKYAITIEVQPLGKGVTEVFGKAQAFGVDGTSITTVRKNFATNASGEMLPMSDEYNAARLTSTAMQLGLVVTLALVGGVGGIIGFKKFVTWYNADERR